MDKNNNIYYLAAPYSHPDPLVRNQRWADVTAAAAMLTQDGMTIISPITSSHFIALMCEPAPPYDYASNRHLCESLMDSCTRMIVLQSGGTDQSVGVAAEVDYMKAQGKPIWHMSTDDDGYRMTLNIHVDVGATQ